jgi:glutamine synthetase
MTPREVLALCREKGVRAVDLRLTSVAGRWLPITLPVQRLDEELLEQGLAADASVVGAPSDVAHPGVMVMPQTETAVVDPSSVATLMLMCNLAEPITGEDFAWDSRGVLARAANYLEGSGVADQAVVSLGLEFYLFRSVRPSTAGVAPAEELGPVPWETPGAAAEPAAEVMPPTQVMSRSDSTVIRGRIMQHLQECGYPLDSQRPGRAAGQHRLELAPLPLRRAGDAVQLTKHLTRQAAQAHGAVATFMPLPLYNFAPSGMSVQLGLVRDQRRVLAGSGYGGLSESGLHAIGGLLRHAPALMALTAASTNSFRRLVEPLADGYSRHSGGLCRVPTPQAGRPGPGVEFALPDGSSNPYLALAAILMAVIDGVQNKMSPGEPIESNGERPLVGRRGGRLPTHLEAALASLQQDHEFLLRGDVFSPALLEAWSQLKRHSEADCLVGRPHPYEYTLYFDC